MNNSSDTTCTIWNTIPIPDDNAALDWLHTSTDILTCTFVIPIIMVVGGLSNLAFIYMVAKLSRMKTITNFYLVNIALADLLLGVLVPGLYIASFFSSPITHDIPFDNKIFCYSAFLLSYFGYLASIGHVTLVSFERYLAVCKPLLHLKVQNKKRTVKLVIGVWILALCIAAIGAPGKGNPLIFCLQWPDDPKYDPLPRTLRACLAMGTGKVREFYTIFPEMLESGSFIVALIANTIFYAFILHALSSRSIASESGKDAQTTQIRNQVARALVINGIIFFITQTPYRLKNINAFIEGIRGTGILTKGQADTITTIGRGGLFLNSAVNSFIYAFSSSFYRQGFREVLGVFFRKQKGDDHSHAAVTETSVTQL
ncbi:kappa-type opioid receptor-like [Amphiura filiformis]|uniref:kappa-type opioid receptor-like n=1 Tax=Amphiura filiformis TaxID=82378 RepID=UPI003B216A04